MILLLLQALRYMELLPPERRPIAGTQGADYRKKQMAKQLPEHDQDPERCHELSPAEVKQMQQYVRKYKDEALGIGDLTLPEQFGSHAGPPQSPGTKPGAPGDQGTAAVGKVGVPGAVGAVSGARPAGNYVSVTFVTYSRRTNLIVFQKVSSIEHKVLS